MSNLSREILPVFFAVLIATLSSKCSAEMKCICGKPGRPNSRIVNGVQAGPHEFPWIVGIRMKVESSEDPAIPFCVGSLVSDRFVLTAGHCLDKMRDKEKWKAFELAFGMHYAPDRKPEIQVRNITRAIMKIQYSERVKDFDVGMLEVDEPVKITDTVYPVCLPYDLEFPTKDPWVVVAGWGLLDSPGMQNAMPSEYLMKSKWMELTNHVNCSETTKYKSRPNSLTDRMVCGVSDATDACVGDSGGPLMFYSPKYHRYFIVGIASFGNGCNVRGEPGVYTNLFNKNVLDWVTCANRGRMCTD